MEQITIEKITGIDKYGKEKIPYFVIKWLKKRLFRKDKWVYLRSPNYDWVRFCYTESTAFKSREDAQLVIDKYLSKGIVIPTTIKENV